MNSSEPQGELSRLILEPGTASPDSQRLVREFFDNLDIPMIVLDRELRILAFTRSVNRLFTIELDAVGKKFLELDSALAKSEWQEGLIGVLEKEIPFELELQDKSGAAFYLLRATPYRVGPGKPMGVLLLFSDVTEVKRNRLLQERYAAIVESSDDAIIAKDVTGVITDWNKSAERLFGYSKEEIVGKRVTTLVPPDHPEDVQKILGSILRGESVRHFETVRLNKSGRRIDVSLSVSPIRDAQGRIVGASKIARDITEKKATELALERGLKLRDEFISIASHELKTPLTSMKLQTQITKRSILKGDPDAFKPEKVMRLVDQTERQVDRLSRLVDDMLDISRISSGRLNLQLEEVDLAELVREIVANLGGFIEAAGCEVVEDYQSGIKGNWDRQRIEQIVTNFITNACRYGAGKPIELRVRSAGSEGFLEVRDHGVGIARADQERIFGRFERAGPASEGGFGLGLFIVREIARLHRGQVGVRSEAGKGSTFWVCLPLR